MTTATLDKPTALQPDVDAIPELLKQYDRWLVWRFDWNDKRGCWAKVPYNVATGGACDHTKPDEWSSWADALLAYLSGEYDGIGFALGMAVDGTEFAGIDLDDCRNEATGELVESAQDIIDAIPTYTEVSPSGTGVKFFCIGSLPAGHRTKNGAGTVEIYSSKRWFAVTGRALNGFGIEHRPDKLAAVWQKYIDSEIEQEKPTAERTSANGQASTEALAAMLPIMPGDDEKDGSHRLIKVCGRAVGHDLSDDDAIATIRQYEEVYPFPSRWSDDDILQRLRDAEQKIERGSEITINNYKLVAKKNDNGETSQVAVPKPLNDIVADIHRVTGEWPRRVGSVVFVDDDDHGIRWFDRNPTAGLFAWLKSKYKVDWRRGSNYVTNAELFSQLAHTAPQYDAIELLPHEPVIPNIYYRGQPPAAGDGSHLSILLDKFRPETRIDRLLIQAAMMTIFWGGPPGMRPAFVLTSDQGRGVGKSKGAEICCYLGGGAIDVDAGENIEVLKQRILSPGGQTKRVAILDNVKSLRFSWAELEKLITIPTISGKQMYTGEADRPNLLTWFLTLNGISLADDMAQRSVIIKVVRGENSGTWYEDTIRYIDEHRQQIIGDIIAALRAERNQLATFSRWATWENDILARLPDPDMAQQLILERQGEANCELDEADIIEEHFAEQLKKLHYDPATIVVHIPNSIAARWYGWATGEPTKTAAASKRLNQLSNEGKLKRIAANPSRTYGRGFVWTGERADVMNGQVLYDLAERLAAMLPKKEWLDAA